MLDGTCQPCDRCSRASRRCSALSRLRSAAPEPSCCRFMRQPARCAWLSGRSTRSSSSPIVPLRGHRCRAACSVLVPGARHLPCRPGPSRRQYGTSRGCDRTAARRLHSRRVAVKTPSLDALRRHAVAGASFRRPRCSVRSTPSASCRRLPFACRRARRTCNTAAPCEGLPCRRARAALRHLARGRRLHQRRLRDATPARADASAALWVARGPPRKAEQLLYFVDKRDGASALGGTALRTGPCHQRLGWAAARAPTAGEDG